MSLPEALSHAKNKGLDLVEMSAQSKPPTCKVMNYGKWKFDNKKREKQNRKKQVKVLIKEIQLRPRTDKNDINIKLKKVNEFLSQGHKVKINVLFSGREMAHKELGFKLLKKVEERLKELAFIESPAKMERRTLFTIFAPTSGRSPAEINKSKVFSLSNQNLEQTEQTEQKEPTEPSQKTTEPSQKKVSD